MKFSSLLRQEMYPAVHVGIDAVILVGDGIDYAARLLGRSAVVQIDQRFAIDGAAKDGEVLPHPHPLSQGEGGRKHL